MAVEDIWPLGQAPSAYAPPATKGNGLVFVSGQVARVPDSGALIRGLADLPAGTAQHLWTGNEHIDGRKGPIRAQTWQICSNIAQILAAAGSSTSRVLRQRVFVTRVEDIPDAEAVLVDHYGDDLPATLFTCMSDIGADPDVLVQIEVVAAVDDAGPINRVYVPDMGSLTAPYPQAVEYNGIVFLSGIMGLDLASGRPYVSIASLPDHVREHIDSGRYHTNVAQEPFKCQIPMIFEHMDRVVSHLGGSLQDVVRLNYFNPIGMHEWVNPGIDYRPVAFPDVNRAPTVTSLCVPRINGDPNCKVIADAVAVLPDRGPQVGRLMPDASMSYLNMSVTAAGLVYTTGYIAMNKETHAPVGTYPEIGAQAPGLAAQRIDCNEAIRSQAWQVYETLRRIVEDAGRGVEDILQQSVFLRDLRDVGVVESVARQALGTERLPATTYVGVNDIGTYDGLLLEVDAVALAG